MNRTITNTVFLIACLWATHVSYAQWTQKASFGTSGIAAGRTSAVTFTIGSKGYIATGSGQTTLKKDLWEWDQATNTWTQKASMPGDPRYNAFGFAIGTKAYIGCGNFDVTPYGRDDVWEWNQATNTWTQKGNFDGGARQEMYYFSIGSKGYVGGGTNFNAGVYAEDLWEYQQATDTWVQKTGIPISASYHLASSFVIGTKAYTVGGFWNGSGTDRLWEYNQTSNTWAQKAVFPLATGPFREAVFSINTDGYVVIEDDQGNLINHLYKYNQTANSWSQLANFTGPYRSGSHGFSLNGLGYLCAGGTNTMFNDLWEFTPCMAPTASVTPAGATTFCQGGSVVLNATTGSGLTYQWMNGAGNISGATAASYTVTQSGSYKCIVYSGSCNATSNIVTVTVNPSPTVNLNSIGNKCINAAPVTLSGSPAGGTYSGNGVSGSVFSPLQAGVGTHTVTYTYTNGSGCSNSSTSVSTVSGLPSVNFSGLSGSYTTSDPPSTLVGSPAGGIFYGQGISGNQFYPGMTNNGSINIVYVYTDGNGCANGYCSSTAISAMIGVDHTDTDASELRIYPNPNNGSFTIETGSPLLSSKVIITDALGKVIKEFSFTRLEKETIDTGMLSKGFYFISISNQEGYSHTSKVLIE